MLSEIKEYYEQIVKLVAMYLSGLFVTVGMKYTLLNRQNLIGGLWCPILLGIIQFESNCIIDFFWKTIYNFS